MIISIFIFITHGGGDGAYQYEQSLNPALVSSAFPKDVTSIELISGEMDPLENEGTKSVNNHINIRSIAIAACVAVTSFGGGYYTRMRHEPQPECYVRSGSPILKLTKC